MGFDKLMAIYWDFWQIPYFKVYVMKGNKVVKVFNQKVVNAVEGSKIALIDKGNKLCWWITEDYIVNKSQIIFLVDMANAVPLKIETLKEISGNIIIKETTKKVLSIDTKKQKIETKNGLPKITVEIQFPPYLLYEKIQAHFIKKIMSEPENKFAVLMPVLIVTVLAGAFLIWQLMSSGGLSGLGK